MTEEEKTKVAECEKCGSHNTFSDDPEGLVCQTCLPAPKSKDSK